MLLQMKQWLIVLCLLMKDLKSLKSTAELILKNADEIAQLIAKEGGKPLKDAIAEVNRSAQVVTTCCRRSEKNSR